VAGKEGLPPYPSDLIRSSYLNAVLNSFSTKRSILIGAGLEDCLFESLQTNLVYFAKIFEVQLEGEWS